MKLELDLPDYVDPELRDIWIFYGREVVARRLRGKKWEIKVTRCDLCGKCCMNLGEQNPLRDPETGNCKHLGFERVQHEGGELVPQYVCKLRGDLVPFACCKGKGTHSECAIVFKEVP